MALKPEGRREAAGATHDPLPTYMPQLDGIRALAVSLVIAWHWIPGVLPSGVTGPTGVRLFFSISGLLITRILLDARANAEREGIGVSAVLKGFFARRSLRIFPVYYATLAIALVLGVESVRSSVWWHVPYLSNVFFALQGQWEGEVSHFWSLAVEEQFYLIWPWLVLLVPRRLLLPAMIAAVAVGPLSRALFLEMGWSMAAVTLTPTALDSLGLGALYAVLSSCHFRPRSAPSVARTAAVIGLGGVALWVAALVAPSATPLASSAAVFGEAAALAWVVVGAATGFSGAVGWLLTRPAVTYLGRISYGLYLFHPFIPGPARRLLGGAGLGTPDERVVLVASLLLLVALSAASWELFERPINRLKERFSYAGMARLREAGRPAQSQIAAVPDVSHA